MKGFKDSVSVATPNSFPHNLTHRVDTTCDLFQFRPVFCEEMYPTDHFKISVADYFRAEPLAGPVYAKYNKKYSAFFVPYRILWDKWNDYLTGGSNGRLEFNVPYFNFGKLAEVATSLYSVTLQATAGNHEKAVYRNMLDFWSDLGVPIDWIFEIENIQDIRPEAYDFKFPLLRFLACRAVWFDWFRDQNLIGDDLRDLYCPKSFASSGLYTPDIEPDAYLDCDFESTTLLMPLPVSVEKDYFTTAMTEPQRGGAAFVPVSLPTAELNPGFANTTQNSNLAVFGDSTRVYKAAQAQNANDIIGMFDYNATRFAKGLQRYLELNGVSGGADLQQLLAHWGTAPNPAVFQRSTYIGSFSDDFNPTEVVSPSDTSAGSLAGEVSTRVNAAGRGEFEYTANEHGFFIIVQTLRPENSYIGGVRRECLHGVLGNGRFDFGTPELEKTGFQPQYTYELCSMIFRDELSSQTSLFKARGYVPRYAELKRSYNRATGQMSTDMFRNLRCARDFGRYIQVADSDLFQNTDFTMVYGYPQDFPYDLMFAVENPLIDHFQGWIQFFVECNRPFHSYAAPLIEDAKGDDVKLPYAGVRM